MDTLSLTRLESLFPELLLAGTALFLLVLTALRGDGACRACVPAASLALALAVLLAPDGGNAPDFVREHFRTDGFTLFGKRLVFLSALACLWLSVPASGERDDTRAEFTILLLLSVAGMGVVVSAASLPALYLGMELQALPLYIIAVMRRDDPRASEAGLKYFVLGALSSGLFLYGASLVYGSVGRMGFHDIADSIAGQAGVTLTTVAGLVLVVSGLAFKMSAAPFHMWTPDVYEGVDTPVTAFLASAGKITALALFARLLLDPLLPLLGEWQQMVVLLSLLSMLAGALGALGQTSIKRLLAYSSIGHAGFVLMGVAAGNSQGAESVLVYLAIYMAMTIGIFSLVLAMRGRDGPPGEISALAGLATSHPWQAFLMAVLLFSLAGIPPLAGFFAKFHVLVAAVEAGLVPLAIAGVVLSVVSAFYYVRIVRIMYFDPPGAEVVPAAPVRGHMATATGLFVLAFFLAPAPLVTAARAAAAGLFP